MKDRNFFFFFFPPRRRLSGDFRSFGYSQPSKEGEIRKKDTKMTTAMSSEKGEKKQRKWETFLFFLSVGEEEKFCSFLLIVILLTESSECDVYRMFFIRCNPKSVIAF